MTDDLVETLRHLDDTGYPGRGTRLDPALVVRAGRRRKRTRQLAGSSVACAVVVALALGVPALVGHLDRDGQTFPVGPPTTIAPTPTTRPTPPAPVEVASPDVLAAVGPFSADPDERAMVDLGTFDGADLQLRRTDLGTGGGMATLTASKAPGKTAAARSGSVVLGTFGALESGGVGYAEFDDPRDGLLTFGILPPDLRQPAVFLVTDLGADGGTKISGLPTFVMPPIEGSPLEGSRPWFAVGVFGDTAARVAEVRGAGDPRTAHHVVFAGADGTIEDPSCGNDECGDATSQSVYGLIRETVATSTPTATPDPGYLATDVSPATPAPEPVVLGPGIAAATGLSSPLTAVDGDEGRYYVAGTFGEASVRLGFGATPTPWYTVFGVQDGKASGSVPGGHPGGRGPLDAAHDSVATSFADIHDGYFETGFAPSGAAHAFVVSTGWLRAADGTHRYAFELPLFAPPPEAAAVMGADRRMYVVAWSPPATDVFFDSTSNVVYVMPDGTIVDPSCDAGGCGTGQMFAQAYDEIRGTLGG